MAQRWWVRSVALIAVVLVAGWYGLTRYHLPAPLDDGKRPLRCAIDAEGGAPYIFLDPANPQRYVGFEVEIAQALERELGRKIELKQYEFASIFSGLERGDFDISISGLELTPERLKQFPFSRPYYVYKLQLVARTGEKRFSKLDDCPGRDLVVGTLENTAAERLLDKMGIKKRTYSGQVEPYRDLALGRIDAVLLDLPIALYHGTKDPKLRFMGEPIAPGYYAIAFNPRENYLKPEFDAALEKLIQSGELQRIYEKWKLWNDDQKELGTDKVRYAALATADQAEKASVWTVSRYGPLLWDGALVTVDITLRSMLVAVVLGMAIALMRLYGPAPLRWFGLVYVEFFRGIPVILLLYFIYYGLPGMAQQLGWGVSLELGAMQAAILGLGLNYAAYESEIYRAGIAALPAGQWEAAASLGMSPTLTFRRIILPQALRVILPPMTNDFVALFKDTSVVSVIAVVELSKKYQILSKDSGKYFEIGMATAILYLLMSLPLGYLSRWLEKRWSAA